MNTHVGAPLRHSPLQLSIRVSSQTPSFYTFRGRGLSYARADRETVEVSNYRAGTSKLSQYRSPEQSLKAVEHIERNCRGIELSSRDFKTVAISVTRAKPTFLNCRAYRADRETVEVSNYRAGTSKLSQYRSLEQSYTVLTHGLHVRALALRHSPLQAT